MRLTSEQKKFVRLNHEKMGVGKMARHLGVEPKAVRRAMAELGLVAPELLDRERAEARRQASEPGPAQRLGSALAVFKRYQPAFWLVVGLALAFRIVHLVQVADSPLFGHLHGDAAELYKWAVSIAGGDWLGRSRPVFLLAPLYPYFLGAIFSALGPSILAACIVQVLLSALSAGLVYHLGRQVFGPVTGLIAGLLAAAYGMFIFNSGLLLETTLVVFLCLLALVTLFSCLARPRWYKWIPAGVFLGLAICARPSLALFGLLALLAVVGWSGLRNVRSWLPACALLIVSTSAAIAPVTLHNLLVGNDVVILTASAGADLYAGNSAQADGISVRQALYRGSRRAKPSQVSRYWMSRTADDIKADFGRWLGLLGKKFKYYFSAYEVPDLHDYYFSQRFSSLLSLPLVTFGAILPLAILGLVISIRGFRKRGLLVYFVLAHLAVLTACVVNGRYRLVVVPVLLVYAAALLRWLWQKCARRRWVTLGVTLVFAALGYLGAYLPVEQIRRLEVDRSAKGGIRSNP